jgi:glycoprotein-N-acetylgalactosamine 3-beta-galactosyltransferase
MPIYFGSKFRAYINQGYMGGGAGYVLSKVALMRFVEDGLKNRTKCRGENNGFEDVEMGKNWLQSFRTST